MKIILLLTVILSQCLFVSADEPNTLSAAEIKAGWRLLFDGKSTKEWRSFGKQSFPSEGWTAQDGWLVKADEKGGGNIITKATFSEFDLTWEWKIVAKGNNGLKYFIIEDRGAIGHEYQMMDDIGIKGKGSTASFYDVLAPSSDKPMKPAGEINLSRIRIQDGNVEHWLNGKKVLQYKLGSQEVLDAVANSKFKKYAGFGKGNKGHILLTDHRDGCWFRNMKIKDLSKK